MSRGLRYGGVAHRDCENGWHAHQCRDVEVDMVVDDWCSEVDSGGQMGLGTGLLSFL